MGNSASSHSESNVFEKELSKLNQIVNDIIGEKDVFKNKNYDFLSQDVCHKYQVILEEELNKHLKLDIKELGTSLFIIPRNEDDESKLTSKNMTKKQICDKLKNHYIKILYIMCLVKYVYNIEKHGDLSISGIVLRNIKIVDDMMQIYFCGLPHKDFGKPPSSADSLKIDFSKLEGLQFFTEYFLTPSESQTFLGILRTILARGSAKSIKNKMCHHLKVNGTRELKSLEQLYASRFSSKLSCAAPTQRGGRLNLRLYIEKDNPVFLTDYCSAPIKLVVKTKTPDGKSVMLAYSRLKENHKRSVDEIASILDRLAYKSPSGHYELSDIDKGELDSIVEDVKTKIKAYYIQSIFDFQNLLDIAKQTPSIHIN